MQKALARFKVSLHCQSFIKFKPVYFDPTELPDFSWVFFSSPQGVTYFLKEFPIKRLAGKKTAAVGPGTAAKMRSFGLVSNFVAQEPNPSDAGKTFASVSGNEAVLFPLSNISKRSVPNCLPDDRVISLVVYETELFTPKERLTEDVLVFTSPSNARAYFQEFSPDEKQNTIAIGETTAGELRKYCNEAQIAVAQIPSEEGIWQAICEITNRK